MKYLKMSGLAMVAAMALTAFLGVGSASATVLCKTAVSPCPVEEKWTANTLLDASNVGNVTWDTGNTCTAATISGKTTGSGSSIEPVPFAVEVLSFSTCTVKTTVVTLGELRIEWITGTNDGTITDRGTSGNVSLASGPCGWNFGSEWVLVGRINGGNPAAIEINAPLITSCPFTRLTGSYTVTTPKPLYVEAS
jgi:hypothetical protein